MAKTLERDWVIVFTVDLRLYRFEVVAETITEAISKAKQLLRPNVVGTVDGVYATLKIKQE